MPHDGGHGQYFSHRRPFLAHEHLDSGVHGPSCEHGRKSYFISRSGSGLNRLAFTPERAATPAPSLSLLSDDDPAPANSRLRCAHASLRIWRRPARHTLVQVRDCSMAAALHGSPSAISMRRGSSVRSAACHCFTSRSPAEGTSKLGVPPPGIQVRTSSNSPSASPCNMKHVSEQGTRVSPAALPTGLDRTLAVPSSMTSAVRFDAFLRRFCCLIVLRRPASVAARTFGSGWRTPCFLQSYTKHRRHSKSRYDSIKSP
mmetsp:Transcript_2989/g.10726  ORF Transcript_2989/g.10726 Transcript_2989/m.10726 type:complete len:258 (-) Transcript_2989:1214-1987(-)